MPLVSKMVWWIEWNFMGEKLNKFRAMRHSFLRILPISKDIFKIRFFFFLLQKSRIRCTKDILIFNRKDIKIFISVLKNLFFVNLESKNCIRVGQVEQVGLQSDKQK